MIYDQAARRTLWGRLRYQFMGTILLTGLVPYLIRVWLMKPGEPLWLINQTLLFGLAAVCCALWLYRNFLTYPGVEDSSHIVTSLSGSFGLTLVLIIAARLDYGRALLAGQYVAALCWFYFIYFRLQRVRLLRIGVIPFGGTGTLPMSPRVEWVPLTDVDADVAGLDAVATDLRVDLPAEWERRLADFALADIRVFHYKHLLESLTGRVELVHLSENSFGTLTPLSTYMVIKHLVDWLVAALFLVLAAPLLILIAVLIRLESPGAALFRQQRIGYQGRPFNVFKFRTMRQVLQSPPATLEDAITQPGDNRITPLGRVLRRTRIDELPQVLNVLRREMSWIGPRPEAEVLSRWYEAELPFYRYRHIVRPGITGWAQVIQGHVASLVDVRDKLHYDFYYIKNYSLSCDILILFRTLRTIVTGEGAK